VSAVGVELMTFECFDKFQSDFCHFFSTIKAIVASLCAERDKDDYRRFVSCFRLLILFWEMAATSILKNKNTDILGYGNPRVLWLYENPSAFHQKLNNH
jgi:hypothetical protein